MKPRVRSVGAWVLVATFAVACDGAADMGDAGPSDAAAQLRPPAAAPLLRAPMNGAYTGSIHVQVGAAVVDHPLRPKLLWAPVERASEYQVQLDDCGADAFVAFASRELDERTPGEPAPSGDGLEFRPSAALPVSTAAPVGRRHVWRVRDAVKNRSLESMPSTDSTSEYNA